MPDEDDPKRYFYYANERGCMKDPDPAVVDELGVGVNDGTKSCSLRINLIRFRDEGRGPRFTMKASAHSDEWRVFTELRDVLDLLSKRQVKYPAEITDPEPFYTLRRDLENLGYKSLGRLRD